MFSNSGLDILKYKKDAYDWFTMRILCVQAEEEEGEEVNGGGEEDKGEGGGRGGGGEREDVRKT